MLQSSKFKLNRKICQLLLPSYSHGLFDPVLVGKLIGAACASCIEYRPLPLSTTNNTNERASIELSGTRVSVSAYAFNFVSDIISIRFNIYLNHSPKYRQVYLKRTY